jgi:hypothetical protein
MAATAPYCVSSDVKSLLLFIGDVGATDFPSSGIPPFDTHIDTMIDMAASRIDMAYHSVGYTIPFEARSGETWNSHQTSFLQYFNAIGVAAMFASPADSPQIAAMRSSKLERSQYGQEWDDLLNGVKAIGRRDASEAIALLRAAARAGSPADYMLSAVRPPLSSLLEGYHDPRKTDLLRDFTNRYRQYFKYMKSQKLPVSSDPTSVHWLYWWHYRLGYTYDY